MTRSSEERSQRLGCRCGGPYFPFCISVCRRGGMISGNFLSPHVLHLVLFFKNFCNGVECGSLLGFRAWCLASGLVCASAKWRRRWCIVGAFTRILDSRVVTVSLCFMHVHHKRF